MSRSGKERRRVLVAPLNWGLGHASRMIPVIHELLKQNAEVIIAADGRPLELLKHEFPELKKIRLPGYDITYQSGGSFTASITRQVPKIISSYFSEKRAIDKLIDDEEIDVVISDNRYGLHSKKARCVFVTHQLAIRMPAGLKWFEPLLFQLNRHIIQRYDECWIPDYDGERNLSGELTRKFSLPANAKFIGPVTRMKNGETKKKYDLLFVLSGPEPQRTMLEEILRAQSAGLHLKMLMVRGVFESHEPRRLRQDFEVVDYMTSDRLNEAIQASGLIVSRPGYSTVMDLAALGSKAIFIPTPGQTEQEYLAEYLMKKRVAFAQPQKDFRLSAAIKESDSYSGFSQFGIGPDPHTIISRLLRNDVTNMRIHSADAPQMTSAADVSGG